MTKYLVLLYFYQITSNLDTSAIIGIVFGAISAMFAAFATWRSTKLSLKVTETTAVLTAWKEFSTAQATQFDTHTKNELSHRESQTRRLELIEGKLETAVLKFNDCERKHAKLEGKFEALGILQTNQGIVLDDQISKQNIQGNRQDAQEERQNEQEERQNLFEHKTIETVEAVVKKNNGDDC